MFWLARLIRLLRPVPPPPTAAMFNVSLGGVQPRPRHCLGTMAKGGATADSHGGDVQCVARGSETATEDMSRNNGKSGTTGGDFGEESAPRDFFLLGHEQFSERALSRAPGVFAKKSFGLCRIDEFWRVRRRAGAGWRPRRRVRGRCRRCRGCLRRRGGRWG